MGGKDGREKGQWKDRRERREMGQRKEEVGRRGEGKEEGGRRGEGKEEGGIGLGLTQIQQGFLFPLPSAASLAQG